MGKYYKGMEYWIQQKDGLYIARVKGRYSHLSAASLDKDEACKMIETKIDEFRDMILQINKTR